MSQWDVSFCMYTNTDDDFIWWQEKKPYLGSFSKVNVANNVLKDFLFAVQTV